MEPPNARVDALREHDDPPNADELEEPGTDVPAATNGHADVPAGSLLDQLRHQREQIARNVTEDFELPNNNGILWATYRLLPRAQIRKYAEFAVKDTKRETTVAAEMIAAACVEVWMRDAEGNRQPWPGRDPELPLRYEPALLDLLKIDLPVGAKTKDIVRAVLAPPPAQREMALDAHQQQLLIWMQSADAEVSEQFAGESQSTQR